MKYSVIIPVYNCSDYLRSCVESLPLSRRDLQVLLIDDGSTDGSGALCDALAAQYDCIRVIHQQNSGVSAARNRGIREAAGEYLLFIDADDMVDTQLLDQLLNDFPGTGADLAIFGICFDYYHHGKQYRSDLLAYAESGLLDSNHWSVHFAELFEANGLSSVWAKIFRKQILAEYGLFFRQDMFLYEDLEYVLRYAAHCGSIYNDPRGIYHYRQSEDEGNAGRRLKRIDRLSGFMKPLEAAMNGLSGIVPETQRKQILLRLYLMLAQGKIGISNLDGIRKLCADYREWSDGKELPVLDRKFQHRLSEGKARSLYLQNKKTALRHKLAVAVKRVIRRS